MAIHFTSDIHFGHDKLREYYPLTRGKFNTVAALDQQIVKNWNARVKSDDTVFVLGDLGYVDSINKHFEQMVGIKVLIPGNHDKKILKYVHHNFIDVVGTYYEEWIEGQFITMCHYPIWEWNSISRGAWHLHGHLHGRPHNIPGRILDVGIDNTSLSPLSFDEVKTFMDLQEIRKFS
jgi:calcineurin-like phosphoesterase family protein